MFRSGFGGTSQSHIEGPFPSMPSMRLRKTGDQLAQGRLRQPFGDPPAQHAIAERSLPRDHQDVSSADFMSSHDEIGQGGARLVLVHAMKIDPPAKRLTFGGDTMMAPRFDGLRLP